MNKFVEFNAVKFLNDAKHWKDRKRKLMQELNAVTELKGRSDDAPTRSGRISDMTANVAAERMRIENKIKRLEKYEEALTYGLSMLPEEQNDVLRAFFLGGGAISHNVDILADKYNSSPRGIYRIRREAVESFQQIITKAYFNK